MLTEEIRNRIKDAMRNKRLVERDILRLALGEIQRIQATKASDLSEEETQRIIRKMIKSNEETRAAAGNRTELISKLTEEIATLNALLPKLWTVEQIVAALPADEIKQAKSDGQATGIAMKHLRSMGAPVDGKAVGAAVKKIRSP